MMRLLNKYLSLPIIAAPMFLVSQPELVIAQCKEGVVGSMPALNARTTAQFSAWITDIKAELAAYTHAHPKKLVAPYAVNLITHASNTRLLDDLAVCEEQRVPIIITSLSARADIVERVHAWGGIILHDVVNARHARKAISQGVDGLILVSAGAGGHAGSLNPFALLGEVRTFYDGPLVLGGAIADGAAVLAALALGADLAYMGTRFIATKEAAAQEAYKQMLLDASASDIVYTPRFSLAPASFLKASVQAAGFDTETLEPLDPNHAPSPSPWRDVWSAGQGVGVIDDIPTVAELVSRLRTEFDQARLSLLARTSI